MSPEENSHQIPRAMGSLILTGSQVGRQAPIWRYLPWSGLYAADTALGRTINLPYSNKATVLQALLFY